MKRAVFPGTFDPVTNGHIAVIKKGLKMFDEVIVAIGTNVKKTHLFDLEQRMKWIQDVFKDNESVKVVSYEGLTVDFCKKMDIDFILRGIRNSTDFNYEQSIAQANKLMADNIETVFVLSDPDYSTISSTIVREIIISGGDYSKFIPFKIEK